MKCLVLGTTLVMVTGFHKIPAVMETNEKDTFKYNRSGYVGEGCLRGYVREGQLNDAGC